MRRHLRRTQPSLTHFPEQSATLAANSHFHLILDRKTLTTAYPQLTVSGGKGAHIELTYAEALYDKTCTKATAMPSLAKSRTQPSASPTASSPTAAITAPSSRSGGAPGAISISTSPPAINHSPSNPSKRSSPPIPSKSAPSSKPATPTSTKSGRSVGAPPALDAHETYMDTPYYEQLQYVGDTRIQALISYTVAGDDRLGRQALEAFNNSRIPEGITRSRYPSSLPQNIPTFSLLWIGMLHDYWMYRPDPAPIREGLHQGTRAVLGWFAKYERPDGLLEKLPWWSFIDWVSTGEIPTYSANSESCVTTLEYLGALNEAADLEKAFGDPHIAAQYRARADARALRALLHNAGAPTASSSPTTPTEELQPAGQHPRRPLRRGSRKISSRTSSTQVLAIEPGTTPDGVLSASYYFRFYLARALEHAGMADDYLRSLDPWRKLLPLHFSTWPEIPGDTRSDSHAWSAHPIYDLLTLVAGIEPASPGIRHRAHRSALGSLPSLTASFPHPQGAYHGRISPDRNTDRLKEVRVARRRSRFPALSPAPSCSTVRLSH